MNSMQIKMLFCFGFSFESFKFNRYFKKRNPNSFFIKRMLLTFSSKKITNTWHQLVSWISKTAWFFKQKTCELEWTLNLSPFVFLTKSPQKLALFKANEVVLWSHSRKPLQIGEVLPGWLSPSPTFYMWLQRLVAP